MATIDSRYAVAKAASALERASTAVASMPPGMGAAEILVKIAERWENLAYQIDSIDSTEIRRAEVAAKITLVEHHGQ